LDFKVRYGCEKQKRLILVEITIGMAAANYLRPKKAEREFVNFKKQQTPPSLWARAAFAVCI